ncbi:MAG: CDP-alcohol phosphatidyltransferase family protein [Chloroflexota bacterium]
MIARLRPSLGWLLTQPVVHLLARTSISPNALTIFGLLLNAVTAWVIATEHLFVAGFLVLLSGWFDMLDGALAKVTGKTSRFGALLDSTVDRISEAVLFVGLLIFYLGQNATLETILIYVSIIGAMLVSYTRARSEGLGINGEVGFFARPERVILLALGLLLSPVSPIAVTVVLWILAVGPNLTALRRLYYGWQQTRNE